MVGGSRQEFSQKVAGLRRCKLGRTGRKKAVIGSLSALSQTLVCIRRLLEEAAGPLGEVGGMRTNERTEFLMRKAIMPPPNPSFQRTAFGSR
jgi:hypothetical protein